MGKRKGEAARGRAGLVEGYVGERGGGVDEAV
jgi:hypothetical protein